MSLAYALIKDKFTQKWNISQLLCLFTPIPTMEDLLKFHNPQNTSGGSKQNSVAAFSWATEEEGDLFKTGTK